MPFGHHESPPSSAPTRLAVGFGPKELSPTLPQALVRAIHPETNWVEISGPPPPRARWGLGVSALFSCWLRYTPALRRCQHLLPLAPDSLYPRRARGSGLPLFTELPRRLILGNSGAKGTKKRAGTIQISSSYYALLKAALRTLAQLVSYRAYPATRTPSALPATPPR